MEKYKNKNGIELSFTNDNDAHQALVKEVVVEAIKILKMHDSNCKISMAMATVSYTHLTLPTKRIV